jgi:hypothetical protein
MMRRQKLVVTIKQKLEVIPKLEGGSSTKNIAGFQGMG